MANVNLFNKIITNHAVDLNDDEIAVLRYTLNQVLSAGNTDYMYWRPTVSPQGELTWELDKSINPVQRQNIRGSDGDNGRTPVFSANPEDAHLLWAYEDSTSGWTDTGFSISGDVGPEGQKGDAGKTPELRENPDTKHLEWEYTYEQGSNWREILQHYYSGISLDIDR